MFSHLVSIVPHTLPSLEPVDTLPELLRLIVPPPVFLLWRTRPHPQFVTMPPVSLLLAARNVFPQSHLHSHITLPIFDLLSVGRIAVNFPNRIPDKSLTLAMAAAFQSLRGRSPPRCHYITIMLVLVGEPVDDAVDGGATLDAILYRRTVHPRPFLQVRLWFDIRSR